VTPSTSNELFRIVAPSTVVAPFIEVVPPAELSSTLFSTSMVLNNVGPSKDALPLINVVPPNSFKITFWLTLKSSSIVVSPLTRVVPPN
jgi:hypothetical protein